MAVTPGACGQRMYPLQMQSVGYRASMWTPDLSRRAVASKRDRSRIMSARLCRMRDGSCHSGNTQDSFSATPTRQAAASRRVLTDLPAG
jgi:hypothetical protein